MKPIHFTLVPILVLAGCGRQEGPPAGAVSLVEARKGGNYDGLVDPADTIPDAAEGNNARVEVKAGDNKHDFHLKKPAGKK